MERHALVASEDAPYDALHGHTVAREQNVVRDSDVENLNRSEVDGNPAISNNGSDSYLVSGIPETVTINLFGSYPSLKLSSERDLVIRRLRGRPRLPLAIEEVIHRDVRGLGLHVAREDSAENGFAEKTAVVNDVPLGDVVQSSSCTSLR